MRLNSIEISGFKSFPERSELSFDGGVTAIVGPNGCGKSNVIDAISWVLGEQSARSLRGERMEDVIFSGSDGRRPTATAEVRIQLSEVTAALAGVRSESGQGHGARHGGQPDPGPGPQLAGALASPDDMAVGAPLDSPVVVPATLVDGLQSMDGLDDDEGGVVIARDVEVARRLYRSGESEYLIDGRVCRLRDIQDLLMDSGVGVKAYAVIEQGKIGQILSARPMERRQLLEEAAGVTKYKSRRRAAELKLQAAQQNLTRVDDIVFEVEKQRGALKRQAAKARRYRRLREELRRWEKVQFAHKSIELRRVIDEATGRLEDTRRREQGASASVTAVERSHDQLQHELTEFERGATRARDAAHAHELEMERRQQEIEFARRQVESLSSTIIEGESELERLEEQRGPLRGELEQQVASSTECEGKRDAAAERLRAAEAAHAESLRSIEGLEGDVEASRSEVFAAINAATALQHVVDNAVEARASIADELSKLDAEVADLTGQSARASSEREQLVVAVDRVRRELDEVRVARSDREAELEATRRAYEQRGEEMRSTERALASMAARAKSMEELLASREGYSDAARLVLSEADGSVAHFGSVADHLDMEREYERAVEASLGELLQYVVVPSLDDAQDGMRLVASRDAGRCGFVVADRAPSSAVDEAPVASLTPLAALVRVSGEAADAVGALLRRRWLAPSVEDAAAAATSIQDPITTPDGTVFRGAFVVHGGGKEEARGILATKGEIRELHDRMARETSQVTRLEAELARCSEQAARAEADLKALQAEEHAAEKVLLGHELGLARLDDELGKLRQKTQLVQNERRKALERREGLDAKQAEAREAIARLETEQRSADERFMLSQRDLLEARGKVEARAADVTDAKAGHAVLAERAAALIADVTRLRKAAQDLDARIERQRAGNHRAAEHRQTLEATIAASETQLEQDARRFEQLRDEVSTIEQRTDDVRTRIAARVDELRASREALDAVRAEVAQLDVHRATAEADLSHLETACREALQQGLEEVCADVEQLESQDAGLVGVSTVDGEAGTAREERGASADADTDADAADEERSADELEPETASGIGSGAGERDTPEVKIAALREKLDRLGPVNMMAIDQFDELEERFDFLTTQRRDLLDSIQTTGDAIKRIDITTRERFKEAFVAVNEHFQEIFSTLFGGGRAGLMLIDETDVLESGIDIIAQPPGKRLQSIQLLSGGEKALTAMSLMFAIFKFKPSPFCLLDEIDAPLDEANIGRFVEMLRGMQDCTQFVLVTHNRKTMEIADRLYGVTMEEPGVSKLISVELN